MSNSLLLSRFQLPTTRSNLVSRPRLVNRLKEGVALDHRLSLISAPAGFGKTTLISEWINTIKRPIAWLSIDESDNDPLSFLSYLTAALNQADPQNGITVLNTQQPDSPQNILTTIINNLTAANSNILLVLDDYHFITNFTVHDLLAFLLENQPASFHVVISTREDPPLPLARLRARAQISEIRERDLRFTAQETNQFLNQTMKLGLSDKSVIALDSRTEGWVTGLQLAGLALRQHHSSEEFVTAFAGDDRYIVDYLMAEVLDSVPQTLRQFLRQTSILNRLTAPLCNKITANNDSQTTLEHLENANLFLIPLDNRREWYRYHSLFAEVLRLSLSDQEQLHLHKEAANWYRANGHADLAAHHNHIANEIAPKLSTTNKRILAQPLPEPLSERELEVLYLIAAGKSNAEIAQQLYITTGTVKRHINHIYGKLQVHSRTQAIVKAQELGLLD